MIEEIPFKHYDHDDKHETYNIMWPCLSSDDFIFKIEDRIGDGLCHDGICGSYSLKVNDVEIASANEKQNYSYREETSFTCSDIYISHNSAYVSLDPSATPSTNSNPSSIPSMLPTISLSPSVEPSPECSCSARLTIHTDRFPAETGWKLSEVGKDGDLILIEEMKKKTGYKKNTEYSHEWSCLQSKEHVFKIEDQYQDGLACFPKSNGSSEKICGWYKLEVDGTVIHSSGSPGESSNFGKGEEVRFFCPVSP